MGWLYDSLSESCCGFGYLSHLGKADWHDSLPEVKVMLESEESQVRVGEVAVVHKHL